LGNLAEKQSALDHTLKTEFNFLNHLPRLKTPDEILLVFCDKKCAALASFAKPIIFAQNEIP